MSRFTQPVARSPRGLNDPRSTGAVKPLTRPDVQAARGTFKRGA
jgi:hypothetical protein